MINPISKIPPTIKYGSLFIFSIILLLHTLDFFRIWLNKILIIIALIIMVYSFIALGGPSKIIALFKTNNSQKSDNGNDHNNDNENELF